MPPKKNGTFNELQQVVIQAVIVADSFNVRFAPLTTEKPRVLLPLVNHPMLNYALEHLQTCGVQEVFVLCCAHSQQIKEHIKKSIWGSENSSMSVTTIVSEAYMSLGDTMREIDAKGFIRSDFILIHGDVICNLPLTDILQAHTNRIEKDKGCIMTMVFRQANPKHRTRSKEDDALICLRSSSNRLIYYEKCGRKKKIRIPKDILQEHSDISLRLDLLDTNISICGKHVPTLFVDNFDFQTRNDFVRGILMNEEILGNSIYVSIAEHGYAARASDFNMYDAVSQNMIQRWTYPVVPDNRVCDSYIYFRHNVYKEEDIELAQACMLEKNVVIGRNTKIGNNSFISNSVIGRNCIIGHNVNIEGSYIWNNVQIGNDCTLNSCLLADEVVLKSGCMVSPGAVLSYNVVIGPNITIKEGTRLQSKPMVEEDDFEEQDTKKSISQDAVCDPGLVGSEGCGYLYTQSSCSDNEDDDEQLLHTWGKKINSEDEDYEESSNDGSENEQSGLDSPVPDDMRLFYNEVLDSLIRGVEENIKCDNLVLEINSSKYAYNMTMKEVNSLLVKAILEIPKSRSEKPLTAQDYAKMTEPLLKQMLPLVSNYIRSQESQNDCLIAIEEFSLDNENFAPMLMKVLKLLYDSEILEEEVLIRWHKKPPVLNDFTTEQQKELRKRVQRFIDWLQEAEEEDSNSD